MPATRPGKASRVKVQAQQTKPRKLGMRLVPIWVPDVRSDKFRAAAQNQSAAVAQSRQAREDQAFIDSNSDWPAA